MRETQVLQVTGTQVTTTTVLERLRDHRFVRIVYHLSYRSHPMLCSDFTEKFPFPRSTLSDLGFP